MNWGGEGGTERESWALLPSHQCQTLRLVATKTKQKKEIRNNIESSHKSARKDQPTLLRGVMWVGAWSHLTIVHDKDTSILLVELADWSEVRGQT